MKKSKNYEPLSELRIVTRYDKLWLEQEFRNDDIYWIWWAFSHSNQIILASVNSENVLTPEDRHLYTFMFDKMQIYPGRDDGQ